MKRVYLVEAIGCQTGLQEFSIKASSLTAAKKLIKAAGFKIIRIVESANTKL